MTRVPQIGSLSKRLVRAVAERVFPGAVLLVQRGAHLVHLSWHGRTATNPKAVPIAADTCFDLASLTKVLSTTSLCLLAVARGELGLDDPVARFLDGYSKEGRERIRVVHLLEHTSGLVAWRPYHLELAGFAGGALVATQAGRNAIRQLVHAERPQAEPGTRVEYSDLGFILLEWVLEKACGATCDRLFAERIARPLGIADLFFVDLGNRRRAGRARAGRVFAATERCPWRGRVLIGQVHDDNAYAMGGVAGHAGLFGTAQAVARLAYEWLQADRERKGLFDPDLVERFWTRSPVPGSSHTLGFDTPCAERSQAGARMGPRTIGHLGFTGTSVWIDPDRELIAVLLSNRVHPSRDNEAIYQFRPGLHDELVAALDGET